MKIYGRSSASDFLGNNMVYRNLDPVDPRLPGLAQVRERVGLPAGVIPRKSQVEYAQVIVDLLRRARALDAPGAAIKRLIFVGDTRLNDGGAYENVCRAGEWPGAAFIGSETDQEAKVDLEATPGGYPLFLANRWTALGDFAEYCKGQSLPVDELTAVVFDLDKTTLGARGRNDGVIDGARVLAVENTVSEVLGGAYDADAFQQAYALFNRVEYHPFTTDNQDYLAYLCLVLGGGLYQKDDLAASILDGGLDNFLQFIEGVEERKDDLPEQLAAIHDEIYVAVKQGDPTPFKAFRREEYRVTIAHMGQMADNTAISELLAGEIVLTQEVYALAQDWRRKGALLFGLSDKPDEASIPTPELAKEGYAAIHQTATHAVGV